MSDLNATTPRVFIVRHGEHQLPFSIHSQLKYTTLGETEWTKNGRYTGETELELTNAGISQVTSTGSYLVGPGKLIDLAGTACLWVSPRQRAQHTFRLLFGNSDVGDKLTLTEDIAEWDYGDYEGLLTREIRAQRKERGLDREREWDIWRDGCEGGEYVAKCDILIGYKSTCKRALTW